MALKPNQKQSFGVSQKDPNVHGSNVYVIKGGSTAVDDKWVQFNDILIDLKSVIYDFLSTQSRRIFNQIGGFLYVLIVLNKDQNIEVVPSISFNKNVNGNIKTFPDLSGKVPLMLVKLTQDGSAGLTGIEDITQEDIELYRGYGNFTLRGPYGDTGPQGYTGINGPTGVFGAAGYMGITGSMGNTGLAGLPVQGATGIMGPQGEVVPVHVVDRLAPPIANFLGDPLIGMPPLSVQFTDLSTGNIDFWAWDFGDGNGSSETGPYNVYSVDGAYTVSLTVSNEAGDSQNLKVGYVVVASTPIIQSVTDDSVDALQNDTDESLDSIQDVTT